VRGGVGGDDGRDKLISFEVKSAVWAGIRYLLVVALDKQTARGEGRGAQNPDVESVLSKELP
jgi:hypothetical protein